MSKFLLFLLLISVGITLNAEAIKESLHDAAMCSPALYKRMIEHGTYKGEIPNCEDNLRALLAKGADPKAKDREGKTPLHHAIKWGNLDLAKILLVAGASTEEIDIDSQTALMISIREYAIQQYQDRKKLPYMQGSALPVIKLLLEYHANPNIKFPGRFNEEGDQTIPYTSGYTPLTLAARHCWADVAHSLLSAGADTKLARSDGATPEFLSRYYECNDVSKLFTKP
jgi:ankyrin repeat protein